MLEDGSEVSAGAVLSNATPKVTFMDLLPEVTTRSLINFVCEAVASSPAPLPTLQSCIEIATLKAWCGPSDAQGLVKELVAIAIVSHF